MQEKRVIKIDATPIELKDFNVDSKQKRRVCAYARVSTNSEDQINSYNAQINEYTKRIQENNEWEFVNMYADEGISGTSYKKRASFNKMIDDARNGLIDLILVKSVSRFSRNTIDSLSIIRELRSIGVEVFFEKENCSSLDERVDFYLTLFSSIAQEESRNISENVKWGIRKRYKEGNIKINTNRFLGYDKDSNGRLIINPVEAETIKDIFALYLLGHSYREICEVLLKENRVNGLGVISWKPATIMNILKNEKYCGDVLLQKRVTIDYLTHKSVINTGQAPQYYIENNHEAIIDKKIFFAVQEMIKSKKGDNTQSRHGKAFPLSGLVICSCCGRVLNRNYYNYRKPSERIVLTCKNSTKEKVKCRMTPIDNETLMMCSNAVLRDIRAFDSDIIEEILKDISLHLDDTPLFEEIEKKKSEIHILENEIRKIIDLRISSKENESDEYLIKHFNEKKLEIQKLNEEIENIKLDFKANITKNQRINQMREILSDNKLVLREVLVSFVKKIIQISPNDVIFCISKNEINTPFSKDMIDKIISMPAIHENAIFNDSKNIRMNYKVIIMEDNIK